MTESGEQNNAPEERGPAADRNEGNPNRIGQLIVLVVLGWEVCKLVVQRAAAKVFAGGAVVSGETAAGYPEPTAEHSESTAEHSESTAEHSATTAEHSATTAEHRGPAEKTGRAADLNLDPQHDTATHQQWGMLLV